MRKCGSCTLCCKLLPVDEGVAVEKRPDGSFNVIMLGWHKMAGEKCRHQVSGKGCRVHGTPQMPMACKAFTCRWLSEPETKDLERPDRVGYVLDVMPDVGVMRDEHSGKEYVLKTIQIWVDPARPDAHHDPKLRAYLRKKFHAGGEVGSVRFDEVHGLTLFPPESNTGATWVEKEWTAGKDLESIKALARAGDEVSIDKIRRVVAEGMARKLEEGE